MAITCPGCRRPIEDEDALLCLYCGASLRRPAGFMGNLKYRPGPLILAAIVLLMILSFVLLVL